MKTVNAIFTIMLLFVCCNITAQSNIWINGYTYTEEQGKQIMIPFATVCVYDYAQKEELRYFAVSGTHGNYSIKPFDYKKQYHIVVEAPGYKTKEFNLKPIPETNNGKLFSGNCTIHILMEKDSLNMICETTPKIYGIDDFKSKDEIKSIPEILNLIPEIEKEGNDWINAKTKGSVCLFLNGTSITTEAYPQLEELPANIVSSIEFYQLPKGGIYESALNIILSIGKQSSTPTYILKQSNLTF